MRRLRARLNGLESHAHQTMSGADQLLGAIRDLVADLQDGISIKLEIAGREFPVSIRIDPEEGDET